MPTCCQDFTKVYSLWDNCDNGCLAVMDKLEVLILFQAKVIIRGIRDPATRLYKATLRLSSTVPSPPPTPDFAASVRHLSNATINPRSTVAQRIAYYHACCFSPQLSTCCFSPQLSTWCAAIDAGYFTTFPELTSAMVRKYPPESIAMNRNF